VVLEVVLGVEVEVVEREARLVDMMVGWRARKNKKNIYKMK
jgi:hypothetical protein